MYHIFLIHSSLNRVSGCSHVMAIINGAEMSTGVHVSFWIMAFSEYVPSSGITGSYGSSMFSIFFFWFHLVLVAAHVIFIASHGLFHSGMHA